jgi:hypothetical protein
MPDKLNQGCCDHGGKRSGCGRKPGIKTQPIRLPEWLLEQLNEQGDPRQLIVDACLSQYLCIKHPHMKKKGLDSND